MKCDMCGSQMILDDKYIRFKGNETNYWICPECNASCVQEIRYNKIKKEYWHREELRITIDYEKNIKKSPYSLTL